ncbi:MAG: hypothetical protein EBV68_07005, partial [Betaproteobacteria bacterium]|nr:hypothetical protein [Betaproteobacteria bacterium]
EPLIAPGVTPTMPLADIAVVRNVFSGNSRERMLQAQEDEWLELAGQLEHRRKQFFDDQAASNLNGHIAEF